MDWIDVLVQVGMRVPWESFFLTRGDDSFERLAGKLEEIQSEQNARQQPAAPLPEITITETPAAHSGTSQLSAEGRACIPCGNDHMSVAIGEIVESIRFADKGGLTHDEVMDRITRAEDELNSFERVDGAPEKVVKLPPHERELMTEMMATSREIRHRLSDMQTVDDLRALAAFGREKRVEFRRRAFKLQFQGLPEPQQRQIKQAALENLLHHKEVDYDHGREFARPA